MARTPSQLSKDASEFGIGVRCGGWRLGLLVARNVAPGKAGRPSKDDNPSPEKDSPAKVSMTKFAELAGVSVSHVKYYYDAWELAAKASLVPPAEKILPGDEDVAVEADSIEVEDNPRTHWSHFYGLAKNPPKEKPVKEKPKPKAEDDFGIEPDESKNEDAEQSVPDEVVAELDQNISRNELLELLESIQGLTSRLARIQANGNDSLLGQIASAAMNLSVTADAMMESQKEEVENANAA